MTDSQPLSTLVQHLQDDQRDRYLSKLNELKISDPYLLPKALFSEVLSSERLPDLQYPDIRNFLFDRRTSMKAYKGLWVKEVLVYEISSSEVFIVTSKVVRSKHLGETPFRPWVAIMSDGEILNGFCTCMARVAESCAHIAATCFAVEAVVRTKTAARCTSVECQWLPPPPSQNVPSAEAINIDFSSPERKRKPGGEVPKPVAPLEIPKPSAEETSIFYAALDQAEKPPIALSMLKEYNSRFVRKPVLLDLPKPLAELYDWKSDFASYDDLLARGNGLCDSLAISQQQVLHIERETKSQAASKTWFLYCAGRITASQYKAVCQASCDNPAVSLIERICYPETYRIADAATRWGCQHECQARDTYILISQHVRQEVKDAGLFIHPEYPFIGASPDACISCSCCGEGILEVVCPYCHKDDTAEEATSGDQPSCLETVGNLLRLKKDHPYYFQVQCQLMATSRKYCDLVLYAKSNFHIERVLPDPDFVNTVPDVSKFHRACILPELIGKWYTRKTRTVESAAPVPDGPCFCKSSDATKMIIKCSSDSCTIKEFHKQCVGLKNAPKKNWLCPHCRVLNFF